MKSTDIAENLVLALEMDNGIHINREESVMTDMVTEIERMNCSYPMNWDRATIWDIAAGESSEVMEKYQNVAGYVKLNELLNFLFDEHCVEG